MEERELITKIQKLKEVHPSEQFVLHTKARIFDRTEQNVLSSLAARVGHFMTIPNVRYAYATIASVFVAVLFISLYTSFDGTGQGGTEIPEPELAVSEVPEVTEYELILENIDNTKRAIAQNIKQRPDQEARALAVQVSELFREAEQAKENLSKTHGVVHEEEEDGENPDKIIAEYLIAQLEGSSLSELQKELLELAQYRLEEGSYGLALEAALGATNNR